MKFVALTIAALFIFSTACFAERLTPNDFLGAWSGGGAGLSGELDSLDILPEGRANFTRRYPDLKREKNVSEPVDAAEAPDLMVIQFRDDRAMKYRIVLSGWKNGGDKMLFGTLYTYDGEKLVSARAVSFGTASP